MKVETGSYMKRAVECHKACCRSLRCKDCIFLETLYRKRPNGRYEEQKNICYCFADHQAVSPYKAACDEYQEPIVFTLEDRQELDRLQAKLKLADHVIA